MEKNKAFRVRARVVHRAFRVQARVSVVQQYKLSSFNLAFSDEAIPVAMSDTGAV